MQKRVDILGKEDMAGPVPVGTMFDSSSGVHLAWVLIVSSSLSIELSALVQDIVYLFQH